MSPGAQLRISDGGWLRGQVGRVHRRCVGQHHAAVLGRFLGTGHRSRRPAVVVANACRGSSGRAAIGAKARAARIFKAQGAAGLLAEITRIEGGWAKRRYFTELFTMNIDPNTARQALEQAGREISSDYELASLLIESGDRPRHRRSHTPCVFRRGANDRKRLRDATGVRVRAQARSAEHRAPGVDARRQPHHCVRLRAGVSADPAGEAAIDRAGPSPVLRRAVDHRERLRAPPRARHAGRPSGSFRRRHGDHAQISGRTQFRLRSGGVPAADFPSTRSKARSAPRSSPRSRRSAGLTNAAVCCRPS